MKLAELKKAGGFIDREPQLVPVKWRDYEFDIHVKKLSFGAVEQLFQESDEKSRSARMISACVLMGEDKEPLSYRDAYDLEVTLATELINAINRINGTGEGDRPN